MLRLSYSQRELELAVSLAFAVVGADGAVRTVVVAISGTGH